MVPLGGGPGVLQPVGLDPVPRYVEEPAELAGVRGQQGPLVEAERQVPQPVGVDQHRLRPGVDLRDPARVVRFQRVAEPGPMTHACTRPSPTDLRVRGPHLGRDRRRPDVRGPCRSSRRSAPRGRQHRGAGVGRRAGTISPTTPRAYLSTRHPARHSAATSACCSASIAGSGRSSPMSTSSTGPAADAAGSTRRPILCVPNVTVRSAWMCVSGDLSGVDVDPARHVDRDHRDAGCPRSPPMGRTAPRP